MVKGRNLLGLIVRGFFENKASTIRGFKKLTMEPLNYMDMIGDMGDCLYLQLVVVLDFFYHDSIALFRQYL